MKMSSQNELKNISGRNEHRWNNSVLSAHAQPIGDRNTPDKIIQ